MINNNPARKHDYDKESADTAAERPNREYPLKYRPRWFLNVDFIVLWRIRGIHPVIIDSPTFSIPHCK